MDRVTCRLRSRLQGYGVLLYCVKCVITSLKATYTRKERRTLSLRSEIYCWTSLQNATKTFIKQQNTGKKVVDAKKLRNDNNII